MHRSFFNGSSFYSLLLSGCAGLSIIQGAGYSDGRLSCKSNYCEHGCKFYAGRDRCFCANGYRHVNGEDERTCELNEPNMGHIYSSNGDQIVRFPIGNAFDSNVYEGDCEVVVTLSKYGGRVYSIDYWPGRDTLLFSVVEQSGVGYLQKYHVESATQSCFVDSMAGVMAVAVDFITNNFYFIVDGSRQGVGVCESEGKFCQMVIEEEKVSRLRGLAVHPRRGLMFLSDVSESGARIEMSSMDGTQRQLLVSQDVQWPLGLTIDYASERLYWVDGGYGIVERVDLRSGKREVIVAEGPQHPMDTLVFNHHIYWTDVFLEALASVDLRNTSRKPILCKQQVDIFGLAISHPAYHLGLEKMAANPCTSKPCSHICLLNGLNESVSFTCRCPFGYEMATAGNVCRPITDYVPYTVVNHSDNKPITVHDPHLCEAELLRLNSLDMACGNGGVLFKRLEEGGYYCRCPTGYVGTFCEVNNTSTTTTLPTTGWSLAVWIRLLIGVFLFLVIIVGITAICCWKRKSTFGVLVFNKKQPTVQPDNKSLTPLPPRKI